MNPGGTRLIPEESVTENGEYTVCIHVLNTKTITFFLNQVVGPTVSSVTFLDLLKFTGKETVIVKMDTEGFECKVRNSHASA